MSSMQPTVERSGNQSLLAWMPRLLLALGASILLAGAFTAIGAPLWLSAAVGALGGARVASSRRLPAIVPRR